MPESDQCPLCERRKEKLSDFCGLHRQAMENLETAYSTWNKAYGSLTREEYYVKLESLSETGGAVKEIIQHLRGKGAET